MVVLGVGLVWWSSLNESPSEKEGKSTATSIARWIAKSLNESPSEKEGKSESA